MSLGTIIVCCDDGQFYCCEGVSGEDWQLSFNEFRADELCVLRPPRAKGEPRVPPKAHDLFYAVIEREGLPVRRLGAVVTAGRQIGRRPALRVTVESWCGAFPARLMESAPASPKKLNRSGGVYICFTPEHQKALAQAQERKREKK